MFGTALYHPYIDIHDGNLLRSAILFWDEIQTIVPTSISKPYKSEETRVCEAEGYLRPLYCDLHGNLLNELGRRVLNIMQDPEGPFRNLMVGSTGQELIHAQKFGDQLRHELRMARMHPKKMSPELRALFPGEAKGDGDWLIVDGRFADAYMAALAAALAREVDVSPLTQENFAHGINLRCLLDDVASSGPTAAKGALLGVSIKALKIAPDVPVHKLIQFRRAREEQLIELSNELDKLRASIEKSESPQELEAKAKQIYTKNVQPGLKKLKRELGNHAIQSVFEGVFRGLTVSVAAGSVLAKFTGWSGELLLGAGAALTATDIAVKSYFARQKARGGSPYTYLFDVHRQFGRPAW